MTATSNDSELTLREAFVFMPRYQGTEYAVGPSAVAPDGLPIHLKGHMERLERIKCSAEGEGARAFLDRNHDGQTELFYPEAFLLMEEGIVVEGTWSKLGLAYRLARRFRGVSPDVELCQEHPAFEAEVQQMKELISQGRVAHHNDCKSGCLGAVVVDLERPAFGFRGFVELPHLNFTDQLARILEALKRGEFTLPPLPPQRLTERIP